MHALIYINYLPVTTASLEASDIVPPPFPSFVFPKIETTFSMCSYPIPDTRSFCATHVCSIIWRIISKKEGSAQFVICERSARDSRAAKMEEETKKMIWKGKIPVCFSLAEDSSGMGGVGMERAAPEPCYVSVE